VVAAESLGQVQVFTPGGLVVLGVVGVRVGDRREPARDRAELVGVQHARLAQDQSLAGHERAVGDGVLQHLGDPLTGARPVGVVGRAVSRIREVHGDRLHELLGCGRLTGAGVDQPGQRILARVAGRGHLAHHPGVVDTEPAGEEPFAGLGKRGGQATCRGHVLVRGGRRDTLAETQPRRERARHATRAPRPRILDPRQKRVPDAVQPPGEPADPTVRLDQLHRAGRVPAVERVRAHQPRELTDRVLDPAQHLFQHVRGHATGGRAVRRLLHQSPPHSPRDPRCSDTIVSNIRTPCTRGMESVDNSSRALSRPRRQRSTPRNSQQHRAANVPALNVPAVAARPVTEPPGHHSAGSTPSSCRARARRPACPGSGSSA